MTGELERVRGVTTQMARWSSPHNEALQNPDLVEHGLPMAGTLSEPKICQNFKGEDPKTAKLRESRLPREPLF